MYKKTLFFLTFAFIAAGCTGGVSDLCTSKYDGKRTISQDRQCLSLVRATYLELEADSTCSHSEA
jgi:hypothetical protein